MGRPKKTVDEVSTINLMVDDVDIEETETIKENVVTVQQKLGGKEMAVEKYLVANLVNVKETFVGRGQSVEHTAELPNGALVFLGDLKAGETHVRKAVVSGTATVTELPYIVAEPEIRPEQYTRMDNALGLFRLKANKPHVAWQSNLYDRIEYSQDFFVDEPAVGDIYELAYGGVQFSAKKPGATGIVLKVVEVKEAWLPVRLNSEGKLFPDSYKLYKVEFVNKTA